MSLKEPKSDKKLRIKSVYCHHLIILWNEEFKTIRIDRSIKGEKIKVMRGFDVQRFFCLFMAEGGKVFPEFVWSLNFFIQIFSRKIFIVYRWGEV